MTTGAHLHPCRDCRVERPRSCCALPYDVRSMLDAVMTASTFGRGETVFHEGAPPQSVYIICSGSVKLVTASNEGKVLLMRVAEAGAVLGLAEAFLGEPYDCSGVATEAALIRKVPREVFLRFVNSSPVTRMCLLEALSDQYQAMQRESRFLAFGGTSASRLARVLLERSTPHADADGVDLHIPPHVTHAELAQSIAATRETVTRVLGDLSRRGLVERTAEEIVVRDEEQLEDLLTY